MNWKRRQDGWHARGELPGDFHDLVILGDGEADAPAPEAVARLLDAPAQALFAEAVRATCAAREARLGWRAGPPLEDWSLVEVRLAGGTLWVTVHEYETDAYSAWTVAFDGGNRAGAVRRRPDGPLTGDPAGAGVAV